MSGACDAGVEHPLLDLRHGRGGLRDVDGDPHHVGARPRELDALGRGRLDVHRVGVRHGLDDDRGAAAHLDGADLHSHGRVAFPLAHRHFNLPDARARAEPGCALCCTLRNLTLAAGTRLGPYEILSPIGAGGMGEVYKARDTRLERTVAIKVLPQHLSSSPEVRQRFEREAKTISQLSHPHICALYDVGSEGENEYLVMEYLEGETLLDRLAKGPLPLEQTLRYGVEIADALDKAHRQGIVHRDLKPANVMLTRSGVKLLDFGLAKAMTPASTAVEPDGAADAAGPDAGRHDPRDVPVHGARAARRQGRRRAHGHLRVRRGALRDGDGQEGVRGRQPGVADHGDHVERAAADLVGPADRARGARSRRPDVPRQGSRGSLAVGERLEARVALDRRRVPVRFVRAAGRGRPSPERLACRLVGRARVRRRRAGGGLRTLARPFGAARGRALLRPAPGENRVRADGGRIRPARDLARRRADRVRRVREDCGSSRCRAA